MNTETKEIPLEARSRNGKFCPILEENPELNLPTVLKGLSGHSQRMAALLLFASLAVASAAEFTVLPLGDSITAGNDHGGYRAQMMEDLTKAGHTVHLLGSQTMKEGGETAKSLLPPHDGLHHEGHGGWRIDHLDGNLAGALNHDKSGAKGYFITGGHDTGRAAIQPDYITFLAGINDINQYYGDKSKAGQPMQAAEVLPILQARITALVTNLHALSPKSFLLIGTVIPYANGLLQDGITGATSEQRKTWAVQDGVTPEQEAGVNHFVILYNQWLKTEFIPAQQAKGLHITLVDQYQNFILPDGKVRGWGKEAPNGYIDFGLHPNQTGYDLMGDTWAKAIIKIAQ